MLGLNKSELKIFSRLSTPIKIQDFLDSLPINFEPNGETYMSPRRALKAKKIHCFEGALLAATALWLKGELALLLDLKAAAPEEDHVVTLYKRHGYWGAISKTNHAALRFRDPVYKTLRELALSYFHEYFSNQTGKKCLRQYSDPFNLKKIGTKWITADEDLDYIVQALDDSPHYSLVAKKNLRLLRRADKMELKAGKLVEWKKI
jgi:hypothetical protein